MDGDIVFYIHSDMIEYGGEIFSTGELTADILNLSEKKYQAIHKNVRRMKDLTEQYERTQNREILAEAQLPVHGSAYADDGVPGI